MVAAQFCKDVGFHQIILEEDAFQVVNLLCSGAKDWNEGGLLIQDALSCLNSFANWSIQHVKRVCNGVAHRLINNALLTNMDLIDLELVPECIKDNILFEASYAN